MSITPISPFKICVYCLLSAATSQGRSHSGQYIVMIRVRMRAISVVVNSKQSAGRMNGLRFYGLFNSTSVISGQWKGDNEKLCAIEPHLRLKGFSTRADIDEVTRAETNVQEKVVHSSIVGTLYGEAAALFIFLLSLFSLG